MAEVIYMRCSTRHQALGDSLSRQLDECRAYARDRGLVIGWVFCDLASGAGRLPQRDAAMLMAKQKRCCVLVESVDRWSRSGADGSDAYKFFCDGRVVECSEIARDFHDKMLSLIEGFQHGR
jgi:DNA invertase Pin-like site-specific DNA recombinase